MALGTFKVISTVPVVIEDAGEVALSYPSGAVFSASTGNGSVQRLLPTGDIIPITGPPTAPGFILLAGTVGPPGPPGPITPGPTGPPGS